MKPSQSISIMAMLVLATTLTAAPDHRKDDEHTSSKHERTNKHTKKENWKEQRQQPGTYKRVQSEPKYEKRVHTVPTYKHPQQKPRKPVNTYVLQQKPHTVKRIDYVRRPHNTRPLPYYHRPGHVTRTLPRLAVTLSLGGLYFYYSDGIYYRHANSGFVVSVPPVGLFVPTLPPARTVVVVGGRTYYTYADVYYVWDNARSSYRVVDIPEASVDYRPGDIIDPLPDGAYSVTIDGRQYFRYAGVYFLEVIQGGRIAYVVVTP